MNIVFLIFQYVKKQNIKEWILFLNLFLDRIYRINWIFLVPHFPEENEENQSDFVGSKHLIEINIFSLGSQTN